MSRTRRRLCIATGSALLGVPFLVRGQHKIAMARVGWVVFTSDPKFGPRESAIEGFRTGLRERGWIEGNNLMLDLRLGDRAQAPAIAKTLVEQGVDVIYADGAMVNGIKSQAGQTPIVFTMSGDPVEAKWVATFARPAGSVTGMTSLHLELEPKRLQFLQEIKPGLNRVAVLAHEAHPGYQSQLGASQAAAQQLGLKLQPVPIRAAADLERAFAAMNQGGAEAIVVFSDTLVNIPTNAKAIAQYALQRRVPSVSAWPSFVEAGNLLSYGPHEREFYRRVASYVDRILRGSKPADLPIELPTRFELTVNRTTAKAIGLALPQTLLLRADRVLQ